MLDIIYNFIRNDFMGQSSTIPGADNLALLITWTIIVLMVLLFVRLAMWAFYLVFKWNKRKFR